MAIGRGSYEIHSDMNETTQNSRSQGLLIRGVDCSNVIQAAAGSTRNSSDFKAEAMKLLASGKAAIFEEACAMVAKENPALYDAYVDQLPDSLKDEEPEDADFMAEADKIVQSGRAKSRDEASLILASERPALYDAYSRQLLKSAE